MPISNILPIDKNPATIVQNTMPTPARPYNFDVEIIMGGLDKDVQKFHYYVTEVEKPKFEMNYEEINQYGYRSNILTGIRFGEVNMTIMDDSDNKSLSFLIAYLNGVMQYDDESSDRGTVYTRFNNPNILPVFESNPELANIKALGGSTGTGVLIQEIRLHQYVSTRFDGTAKDRIRTWIFHDPQFTNIDMSTFSVEDDEVGKFNMGFNFKNVTFALDTEDYPDTPFDLLRAAVIADNIEGGLTASPGTYIKAISNNATQLATSSLNIGVLPGIAGGGAGLALSKGITSSSGNSPIAKAPPVGEIDKERSKNGFIDPTKQVTIKSTNVAKTVPSASAQASKLDKLI